MPDAKGRGDSGQWRKRSSRLSFRENRPARRTSRSPPARAQDGKKRKRGDSPARRASASPPATPGRRESKRIRESPRQGGPAGRGGRAAAVVGRKQKGKPSPRKGRGQVRMEYDAGTILRSYPLPKADEFDQINAQTIQNPKNVLGNGLNGVLRIEQRFERGRELFFKCRLTCTPEFDDEESITVLGEGVKQKDAQHAAYLHLLSKLYENGILKKIWGDPMTNLDNDTMQKEKDAMLDIYHYAAKFLAVPKFTVSHPDVLSKSKKGRKNVVEVTAELPDQGIKVVSRASSVRMAEVAASLQFKEEAERYHAEKGTSRSLLNDSRSLNVVNCKAFFEYLKEARPRLQADVFVHESSEKELAVAEAIVNFVTVGEPVEAIGKKRAQDLAWLVAAIHVAKEEPELLPPFFKALKAGNGQILPRAPPVAIRLERGILDEIDMTLDDAIDAGLNDLRDDHGEANEDRGDQRRMYRRVPLSETEAVMRSSDLLSSLIKFRERTDLKELRDKRAALPMSQYASQVIDLVENNLYSIIVGATGSGKTTQVPQIIIDDAIRDGTGARCNVICTQPRRIAATSVARRVAEERAQALQESVGYHVRFDPKLPKPGGSITYCTTGILLQQLQHQPDNVFDNISHLVIDEVHERDMLIDFLLIVLKKTIARRIDEGKSVPKVVLMSATMDAELFAGYFKSAHPQLGGTECPTLSVPGRTFPVEEHHLNEITSALTEKYDKRQLGFMTAEKNTVEYFEAEEKFSKQKPISKMEVDEEEDDENIIDWKRQVDAGGAIMTSSEADDAVVPLGLIAGTVAHIAKTTDDGAVLIFLPGLDEIVKIEEMLKKDRPLGVDFTDENRFRLFLLHSSIQDSQRSVFEQVPEGCRKIILSTNIAETSVTIPDVQFVVDSGKLREKRYDQLRRITKLQCTWISKSNAKQRAGRAGRVQNGHYYALYSKARASSLSAVGLPELLRSDLQETCLDIKAQAFQAPIREFLQDAIQPPDPEAVELAIDNLVALDALSESEELTSLGRLLASLPVHPSLGKMIVLGIVFRCLDPMIVIGSLASERGLFVSPLERRKEANAAKQSFVRGTASDHLAAYSAFYDMRDIYLKDGEAALRSYARYNFLHVGAFRGIYGTGKQIRDILFEAKLIPKDPPNQIPFGNDVLNENAGEIEMIKALLVAGLHPNLGISTNGFLFRTPAEKTTLLHPSSVNCSGYMPKKGAAAGTATPPREPKLVAYSTLARANAGNSIFLRDTTAVAPLAPALFGGKLTLSPTLGDRHLELDGWLPLYTQSRERRRGGSAAHAVLDLRRALDRMLAAAFADLSKREHLAEDRLRRVFAGGVAEVLARDAAARAEAEADTWRPGGAMVAVGSGGGGGGGGGGARAHGWFGLDGVDDYGRDVARGRYGSADVERRRKASDQSLSRVRSRSSRSFGRKRGGESSSSDEERGDYMETGGVGLRYED